MKKGKYIILLLLLVTWDATLMAQNDFYNNANNRFPAGIFKIDIFSPFSSPQLVQFGHEIVFSPKNSIQIEGGKLNKGIEYENSTPGNDVQSLYGYQYAIGYRRRISPINERFYMAFKYVHRLTYIHGKGSYRLHTQQGTPYTRFAGYEIKRKRGAVYGLLGYQHIFNNGLCFDIGLGLRFYSGIISSGFTPAFEGANLIPGSTNTSDAFTIDEPIPIWLSVKVGYAIFHGH